MSLPKPALQERGGFFITSELEPARLEEEEEEGGTGDEQRLLLPKRNDSETRLKDLMDMLRAARRHAAVWPEQLSALVDCVLTNFKRKRRTEDGATLVSDGAGAQSRVGWFDCPACGNFLWEAVTLSCGHSYCKGCLQNGTVGACKVGSCGQDVEVKPGELRANVVLSGLLEKWFPEETQRWRAVGEAEALLTSDKFDRALLLATKLLESDRTNVRLRVCRAKAYRALQCYHRALEDWDVCLSVAPSLEAYFCKAKVLLEMGEVDDSLQLFLECLAVDENFQQAKQEVEKILLELLSPACESVEVSLRETLSHSRSKAALLQSAVQNPCTDPLLQNSEKLGRSECLERSRLNRAQSLRAHGAHGLGGAKEEGLKRVCSAPQLGDPEKGVLLKRKLSGLEAGPSVVNTHGNKQKKQGVTVAGATVVTEEEEKLDLTVPRDLLDPNDFECSLCMRLFYEPVTTPCGHTFCRSCLERCLDHSPQCPLCKESLKVYLASRKYKVTALLDDIIKLYLSGEHATRERLHTEETKELSDLQKSVPIFVCTMAYPTVPCPLHVFEPRYRLMIRRCMETGTRQFGMCIHDAQKGFADYGCMLHIRSVHFLPDGRSVVDTVGGKRFRVLSRDMRDGYCTADIDYLEDQRVVDKVEVERLRELHDQVYDQARGWFQTLENRFRNQILQHFGPMPEREDDIQVTPNGPACCWWLLAVLPVDPRYQLSLLSMTTLKERLIKIQHILTYLQNTHNE